uniref:Integrase catalytic domain-containing protein n=1 Tax=Amphiprion percula TaxID=161767 RepID=A0A3P8SAU4_AMPPE
MAADIEHKIKTCGRCIRRKALPEKAAPLVSIQTSRPLELLCMDFLSLEPDTSNTKDILVLTDHFTKFAMAIPTPNQKARTVARSLWDNFIVYYGIPERLHSDQGPDFESKLIRELCEVAGIQKCRTTPYHPRGNPVERFNRTLLNMLGTLEKKQKSKWREYVKPLVHAYNCTRNEVTGFTPYELMFGRSPRLPVDLAFGLPVTNNHPQPHSQYVHDLKQRLEESYQIASRNAAKNAGRNKARFDQHVKPSKLEVGDRVLVRNVRVRGKHKLSDKWEQDIFVVVKQAGDLPVYTVKPENKDGPNRTLHRDLLLPCGFLPVAEPSVEILPVPEPRLTRLQSRTMHESAEESGGEDNFMVEVAVNPTVEPKKFTVERTRVANLSPSRNVQSLDPETLPAIGLENLPDPVVVNSPDPLDVNLPAPVDESESEIENLPENSPVMPDDLPDHLPSPPNPSLLDVPLDDDNPGENGNSETNLFEPQNLECIPNLPDAEPTLRRSIRHRSPPKRFNYASLGNPLIYVVQTLLHSLSDALGASTDASSPAVHIV